MARGSEISRSMRPFRREIRQILGSEYDVRFPAGKRVAADWTAAGVHEALDRLFNDPDVDFVVTLGVLSSNDAALRGPLPKPTFAPFIIEPDLQDTPIEVRENPVPGREVAETYRVSGVPNLSYVVLGDRLPAEIEVFREIVPFSRLAILSMKALQESIPRLRTNMLRRLEPLGIRGSLVTVGDSLEDALAAIPPETEAVYVAPLLQLPPGDFDRLADALIERKLPSFSLWGRSEVERGLLASLALDLDMDRLARRSIRPS